MDNFSSLEKSLSAALVATTRTTTRLAAEDIPFHRSLDPSFAQRLDRQNARLLALAERLLNSASAADHHASAAQTGSAPGPVHRPVPQAVGLPNDPSSTSSNSDPQRQQQQQQQEEEEEAQQSRRVGQAGSGRSGWDQRGRLRLRDADALDTQWRGVVDVVDSLLERADTSLDEFTGAVKRLSPRLQAAAAKLKPKKLANNFRIANVVKPQLSFEVPPNNYETGAFLPLLTSKPHAAICLEESLQLEKNEEGEDQYSHPYKTEIEQYDFPDFVRTVAEPIPYGPLEERTPTWVDTIEAMEEMLEHLKGAKEIAIDLEHHDKRTYVGLVSLMQISTRDRDFVVDTLKPWRRKLERLNQVFTDPGIVKVLHGAYMDIVWLQRDLGLYIVGLFDTYFASRALGYAGGSLAFLLQKFIGFEAQKQYQLADWRIRPLPAELLSYAQSDTHFLLHIYSQMRNELIERPSPTPEDPTRLRPLDSVLEKSKETALQVYTHESIDLETGLGSAGWYRSFRRHSAHLDPVQFAVYRALYNWRDTVARELDESPFYVMKPHTLLTVARTLPAAMPPLLNVLTENASPPTKDRAAEILQLIADAKERGQRDGRSVEELLSQAEDLLREKRGIPPPTSVAQYLPQITQLTAISRPKASEPTAAASPVPGMGASMFTTTASLSQPQSAFWGSVPCRTFSSQAGTPTAPDIAGLIMPLPVLSAVATAQHETNPVSREKQSDASNGDHTSRDSSHDTVFVVKEAGGARKKRSAADVEQIGHAGDGVGNGETPDDAEKLAAARAEKKARKAAKKERKAAARLASEHDTGLAPSNDLPTADQPFDYEAAPNFLQLSQAGRKEREGRGGRGGPLAFDPFKTALEADAGPKKKKGRNGGSGGKSGTFK